VVEKPWRALRERPEIEFLLCDLPDGVKAIYAQRGDDRAILVSRRLGAAERLAAVAHELAHDDRGGGCHHPDLPPLLRVATVREEARVQAIVADQLVPPTALAEFVERRSEVEHVVAWMVAEEFGVPADVASLALDRLASGF
jgi:hypothetical protein